MCIANSNERGWNKDQGDCVAMHVHSGSIHAFVVWVLCAQRVCVSVCVPNLKWIDSLRMRVLSVQLQSNCNMYMRVGTFDLHTHWRRTERGCRAELYMSFCTVVVCADSDHDPIQLKSS